MSNWHSLPRLTAIQVSGPDALAFCQAQFTTDFRAIGPGYWQVCAWCEPKGRCLSLILASVHEDRVELIAPTSQVELFARLKLYAIGRKVQFAAPEPVAGRFGGAAGDLQFGQRCPRALRVGGGERAGAEFERAWRIADLCEPLPWLDPNHSGRYLPQFLGLEENGGLSYKKGCFPGQEVIARVHYLGSVKQKLLGFSLTTNRLANPAELGRLQSDGAGEAEPLDWLVLERGIIGLAVCPMVWQAGLKIRASAAERTLEGQMVTSDALCYYLPNNDYKHGTNQ